MDDKTIPENPDAEAPARLSNGQFPKGVSGRRFKSKATVHATVEDLLDANAFMVAETLIRIIKDPKTAGGPRVAAIREFGDRWIGRPTQTTITKKAHDEHEEIDLSQLSEEALRELTQATTRKDK